MADENCPSLLGTLDFLKFPDIPNLDINQSIQPKIDDINNQLSSMSDFSSQGTLVVPSELSSQADLTHESVSKFSDSNSKEVSIDESSSESESKSESESESKSESESEPEEDVFYTPASSESELSSMSDASSDTSSDTSVKQSGGKKKKNKKW
jgi:hypothetical protein